LAASDWWLTELYLEQGQQIQVVVVDFTDSDDVYQHVIPPPGALPGINAGFTGTYFDATRAAQGVLLDLDETFDILFAALFSYTSTPASTESVGASGKQSVGSGDQRWLTAYGSFSTDSTEVDLSFENTSGGRFNSIEPPIERDSSYGTGKLIAHDCKRIDIEYDLPDAQGVFTLTRGLPGFNEECARELPVAAPEESW
jgi:hypothetical protein